MQLPSEMTDSQLSFAFTDVKETLHKTDSHNPYSAKLWRQYDALLDELAARCVTEYHQRYNERFLLY